MESSDDSNKSFLKNVFNFDDDSKSEILNIIQYALLAIIPIVLLNKSIIASDCPNSPKELLMNGLCGYLFKNNSKVDLVKKFISYKEDSLNTVNKKIILAKKNFKKFSFFNHYLQINKIISTND